MDTIVEAIYPMRHRYILLRSLRGLGRDDKPRFGYQFRTTRLDILMHHVDIPIKECKKVLCDSNEFSF